MNVRDKIFTTMVQTMSLSSNTGMHGSTPDKVTGAFVIVYVYLLLLFIIMYVFLFVFAPPIKIGMQGSTDSW